MGTFSDLRSSHAELGPRRFWLLMFATVTCILVLAGAKMWLEHKTGWPDAYGFHCRGRGCIIDDLIHSPALLRKGGRYEISLFALLWLVPAIVLGAAIVALIKRVRGDRAR